jgi:hypothetical protein
MKLDRLSIDVPKSDARRDRVVSSVLARVAVMRASDRAEAVTAEPRSRIRLALGLAAVAAAAVAVIVVLMWGHTQAPMSSPSLVVTPIGGSSRFTVGDAMIDAGPDTSVEVHTDGDGAVTLALARGSVECDVAPRAGRPPFRVVAGDVTVEVVGTRFTVARRPEVRVDVARGKVKVIAATATSYVLPGESWPAVAPAPAAPAPVAPAPSEIEAPPPPTPPAAPAAAPPQVVFKEAQRLRQRDPDKAAHLYRTLANHADVWAALSLYDLAEMHGSAQLDAALRELDELDRRFPHAANLEDAAWLRIEILRKAGRTDDARRAASAYLRRFPSGTYVDQAARVAAP